MGYGDELMALGRAQALAARNGKRVAITDRHGRVRQHQLWRGERCLVGPDEKITSDCVGMADGGGCRPYIDYARTTAERWAYLPYKATPARLHCVVPDRRGAGRIVIEPTIKSNASPNKRWWGWQALVSLAPTLPWAQMGVPGSAWLTGVERIETASFEAAMNVLAAARAAVLPEGGLHHGAAAVGLPSVVLFGAYTPVAMTGYAGHVNLGVEDIKALGWRVPHPRCAAAWEKISPDLVLTKLRTII